MSKATVFPFPMTTRQGPMNELGSLMRLTQTPKEYVQANNIANNYPLKPLMPFVYATKITVTSIAGEYDLKISDNARLGLP